MITEKDIQALKGPSKKMSYVSYAALIIVLCIFSYSTFHNISLSFKYAEEFGLDREENFALWNSEPELDRNYSGYEQQSLYRLNMAIINFGVVIIVFMQLTSTIILRKRDKRIYQTLKQSGVITND